MERAPADSVQLLVSARDLLDPLTIVLGTTQLLLRDPAIEGTTRARLQHLEEGVQRLRRELAALEELLSAYVEERAGELPEQPRSYTADGAQ